MKCLIALAFVCALYADTKCAIALVEYDSPSVSTSPNLAEPDSLLSKQVSFGCIKVNEQSVTIVQTLSAGSPVTVLTIPKYAVTKLTFLGVVDDPATDPQQQVLPDVRQNNPSSMLVIGRKTDNRKMQLRSQ